MADTPREEALRVLHPVYLDVPMMVSFLASLTGGVSFEDETTHRSASSSERGREAGGGIRLPSIGSLFGLDASGRVHRQEQDDDSQEVKAVRQHTAASLFNALYETLKNEHSVIRIDDAEDLKRLRPGDIVEITGEFVGNPLQEIIGFFAQALPYFALGQQEQQAALQAANEVDVESVQAEVQTLQTEAQALREQAAQASRSGNPQRRAEGDDLIAQAQEKEARAQETAEAAVQALKPLVDWQEQNRGILMMGQMRDDLANAAVHDTVLNGPGLRAILTMSTEYFTDITSAHLRAGIFTAVGKITRILDAEDQINLLRRTVLAGAGTDFARSLIDNAASSEDFKIETFDPIIEAPAVQVLPLAVFI